MAKAKVGTTITTITVGPREARALRQALSRFEDEESGPAKLCGNVYHALNGVELPEVQE